MRSSTIAAAPESDRDEELLHQIRLAQRREDGALRQSHLLSELLARQAGMVRRLAAVRLDSWEFAEADLDVLINVVFKRLADALVANDYSFDKPFRYVVLDNVDWAVLDLKRQLVRRRREDPVEDPDSVRSDSPDGASMLEQARDLNELIEGLNERDKRIAVGRIFLGQPPGELAAELGISRSAFDTAYHRLLDRLAESDKMRDERNRRRRTEG